MDNDGGPAFPGPINHVTSTLPTRYKGMSFRDWLVGQTLRGIAGVPLPHEEGDRREGIESYMDRAEAYADEYLRRRKERGNSE